MTPNTGSKVDGLQEVQVTPSNDYWLSYTGFSLRVSLRGLFFLSVTTALWFMGLRFTGPYRYGSLDLVTARGWVMLGEQR